MGRHHDQIRLVGPGRLQNCLDWIAVEQYATDGETLGRRAERVDFSVFLSFSQHGSKQIPASQFWTSFGHAGSVTLRCHCAYSVARPE